MGREQRQLTRSITLYRLLLLAYPARYRCEFGVEMVQVFRDDMRSTIQERGSWGLAGRWLLIFIDLIRSAFAKHIWEVFHMPVHTLARWNGVAAALGGALFVFIAVFNSAGIGAGGAFFRFLRFLLPLVLLWGLGLGGLYRHLPRSAHMAGRIATGTALLSLFFIAAGVLLLDLTESDAAWGLLMVGFYGLVAPSPAWASLPLSITPWAPGVVSSCCWRRRCSVSSSPAMPTTSRTIRRSSSPSL